MAQTVLPFRLDSFDKPLTAQGGLGLFGEILQAPNLLHQLNEVLSALRSQKGYDPLHIVTHLLLMLLGGGRIQRIFARFEELRRGITQREKTILQRDRGDF